MTRPRIPASAMTRSLPRPRMRCGSSRVRANRTSARKLVGVVGGREQVGRATDPHRREPGQRLVARGLDPDPALDLGAGAMASKVAIMRPRRGRAARSRRIGERRPAGRGQDELGHRVGRSRTSRAPAPRPPSARGRPDRRAGRGRHEERLGVERLVLDEPGRTGVDQGRRVGALVTGRVRIRHDDHRQPEGGDLGQRRRAQPVRRRGPPRPGRPASRRAGTDTGGSGPRVGFRERLATGERRGVAVVAGHVDDRHSLDQPRQGIGDGRVEAADRLRPTEDEQHRASSGPRSIRSRAAARSMAATSRIGVPVT